MPAKSVLVAVAVALMSLGNAASSQEHQTSGWNYNLAVYLWGAGIEGTTPSGDEIDVSFSDLWDNLEFGGMGSFQARKAKWSITTDIIYLDVGAGRGGTISRTVGGGRVLTATKNADLDLTGWVVHLKVGNEVFQSQQGTLELIGGVRYLDVDAALELRLNGPRQNRVRRLSTGVSSWDGFVGLRGRLDINENWYVPYYLDGGLGQADFSYQAAAGVAYRFGWGDVSVLYRHLHWDFDGGEALRDITFSGPMAGAVFRF